MLPRLRGSTRCPRRGVIRPAPRPLDSKPQPTCSRRIKMFSYFGCKSKIAHLYPAPRYPLICEPFGGSGRFGLFHADRYVWLNELNPRIYRIWRWLQQATRQDIERLPDLKRGDDLRQFHQLSDVERDLLGMCVCRAQA